LYFSSLRVALPCRRRHAFDAAGKMPALSVCYFRGNPKLYAAVESHPNVEKHDVRMGHPPTRLSDQAAVCKQNDNPLTKP